MSNFIHAAGVSGFIKTPFQLITAADTGISGLTNGSAVLSANGGALTTGIFSQSDFANAQYGEIWLEVVTAGWTPSVAGSNLSGWFLKSTDGGTTFETKEATPSSTVPALGRSPDWVINLYEGGNALAAGAKKFASGPVPLPYLGCKVLIQSNCSVTFGTGAHLIKCGPVADTFG